MLKALGLQADLNIMDTSFPDIFFLVLIPPIIYDSAYIMNKVNVHWIIQQ